MMKKNCWEFKRCGREGGKQEEEFRICPAVYSVVLDGAHDGTCGGRACWTVKGTFCNGTVHGTFEQKFKECSTCDFYEYVKEQEGDELLPTFILLEKIEGLEQS